MESETLVASYRDNILGNYGERTLTLVKGEGSYVYDDTGRSYLDFSTGIAVNALGHAHPAISERICKQAEKLIHCSNLYRNEAQAELASKLIAYTGPGKLLFCNSGAEANEALIKLARLHGQKRCGEEGKIYTVLTAMEAFHGRTFGGMSATPQDKIQKGFRPLLDGFAHGTLNDSASFKSLTDDTTAGILLETIQGEGGVRSTETSFLKDIASLCNDHNVLFMLDEVQCGIGRTGNFFAFEKHGVKPDAIGMAKGLGGGFPIGAVWISDSYAELFTPGSHGTTFGGNPIACSAAIAVIETIENEKLLEHVSTQSTRWKSKLRELADKFTDIIDSIRGEGFMIGIKIKPEAKSFNEKLAENGLLAPIAGENVIRLLPPLTASAVDLDNCTSIIEKTAEEWNKEG